MAEDWIENELLVAFYSVVSDFRDGYTDFDTFRGRLFQIAERYERTAALPHTDNSQKELF